MFSASVQWVFCRSSSTCRCISTVSVGRKVISASYSSAIFSIPPAIGFFVSISFISALIFMIFFLLLTLGLFLLLLFFL